MISIGFILILKYIIYYYTSITIYSIINFYFFLLILYRRTWIEELVRFIYIIEVKGVAILLLIN